MRALLPSTLPSFGQLIAALDNPRPGELARILGVTERTIRNYAMRDSAPRGVRLALFWLTPWGASALNTHRENELKIQQNLAESLQRENHGLRQRIARLEATGSFGAGNAAVLDPQAAPLRRPPPRDRNYG